VKHKTLLLTLAFLLGSIAAFAQAPQNLAGTYEGMVKRPGAATEDKVSLELKTDGGKISGRATHGTMTIESTDAKLENGTLTLNFGKDASFVGKVDGDKLVGNLIHGANEKVPVELKKVVPAAAAAAPATPAAPAAAPAAAFNLNGQWDAVADANGQPFPFLLTLKVDGESVTGGSSSQLGEATVKNGSWKDGKLSFELEGSNGTIVMSATVVDGKLSGEFDYSGQLQGKWVAVKKN
jgi:opacity protein-like surface antigen